MLKLIFLTAVGVCSSAAVWVYAHGRVPGIADFPSASTTAASSDAPPFPGASGGKGAATGEIVPGAKVPPPILGTPRKDPFAEFVPPPADSGVAISPRAIGPREIEPLPPRLELPRAPDSDSGSLPPIPLASSQDSPIDDDVPALAQRRFPEVERFTSQSRTLPSVTWQKMYESTQRRGIETASVGQGKVDVLVLASLHGDELLAPLMVERLAEEIASVATPQRTRILFVRTPNPDGLARRTRTNSRGIDLNRSFPRVQKRFGGLMQASAPQATEFETRAVQRALQDYGPRRVVHLKTTVDRNGWILCNSLTRGTATTLSQRYGFRMFSIEVTPIAGSLEEYLTSQKIEALTVALPVAGQQTETLWQRHRELLLSVVGISTVVPVRPMSPGNVSPNPQPVAPRNVTPNRTDSPPPIPQRPQGGPILQGPTSSRQPAGTRGPVQIPDGIELGAPEPVSGKPLIRDTARQSADPVANPVGSGYIELPPAP